MIHRPRRPASSLARLSIRLLALALALVAGAATAKATAVEDAPELGPDDFAVGRELIAEDPAALHSVYLDFDVYRRSVESRLADLRVFDDRGQPVPYAIRRRLPDEAPAPEAVSVPFFRLDAKPGFSFSFGGRVGGSDYQIDAELSTSGAVLSIHRGPGAPTQPSEAIGWLLDTSAFDRGVARLDFSLEDGAEDFVSRLRLERSDDLARWQPVETQIAVARLEHEGHRIERSSFEIPTTKARYLRLTPIDEPPPFDLSAVHAVLAPRKPTPRRFEQRIAGQVDPAEPGIVRFDLEGLPPIESVQVLLDEMNSIVEGTLESAALPEGPWRVRQRGVFYRFDRGGELRNPKAVWSASRDRYLRFVASKRGGGLRGQPPQLEIVWQPEQLLYLEREDGNSTLAIGRAGALDGSFAASDLLRMSGRSNSDYTHATARLGPEFTLAGDSVLEVRTPLPWRTYGLWAVLLAIVGLVLGLSLRLLRSEGD